MMLDFIVTPAIEWIENNFAERQKFYRENTENLHDNPVYTARVMSFKDDLCKCSDEQINVNCTSLVTEGANSTHNCWRLESIEEIVHERIRVDSSN